MVVPVNPVFTARGRTPLEPQFFYTQSAPVLLTPDTTKIFRGHLRSLPDQPTPPNAYQSWTYNGTIYLAASTVQGPLGVVANQYSWPLPQPAQQPQFWQQPYNANLYPGLDRTKIFRGHLRSLPDQPVAPLQQQPVFQAYPPLHPAAPGPLGVVANQYDWPVPKAPQQPAPSYIASYNLNLIGQDRLPTGKQVYDLSPKGYEQDWRRSWEWRYNLNLIGQDQLPPGKLNYELVPRDHQRFFQTWVQTVNLPLIPVVPAYPLTTFSQYDWPLPRPQAPAPPSWTASYNQNLIGQDKLPSGEQITDLAPRDYQRLFQTWIQNVNLALTTAPIVGPLGIVANQYDWPVPRDFSRLLQTWTANVSQALTVPPPIRQRDWPNPSRGYEPDWRRDWEWWYNLNLIGQDKFPPGGQSYDLAPRDYQRQLQTWSQSLSLPTTTPPFNQYDWPVPKAPQQPALSWTASYNLNLIGQDQLPAGAQSYALTPADFQRVLQTWITNVSLALVTPPVLGPLGIVANQYDWPVPKGPPPLVSDWPQQNLTIKLPPFVPPVGLHQNPFFITMGRLSELGNLPS